MPPKRKAKEALYPAGGPMGFVRQNTKGDNTKGKGKVREEAMVDANADGGEDEYQPQPKKHQTEKADATNKRPAAKRAREDSSPDSEPVVGRAPKRSFTEEHLMDQRIESEKYPYMNPLQEFEPGNVSWKYDQGNLWDNDDRPQDDPMELVPTLGDEDENMMDVEEDSMVEDDEEPFGIDDYTVDPEYILDMRNEAWANLHEYT